MIYKNNYKKQQCNLLNINSLQKAARIRARTCGQVLWPNLWPEFGPEDFPEETC